MPVLAQLRRFAGTRRGKIALGGGAAGAAAVAGLAMRRRAGGDPTADGAASSPAPPFGVASGATGVNDDAFTSLASSGVDVGAFDDLITTSGRIADSLDAILANQGTVTTPGGPRPVPTPTPAVPHPTTGIQLHRIGVVGQTYGLRDIARRYAPDPNNPNSVEAMLRRIVAANPKLRNSTTVPGGFALLVPVGPAAG